jgi:hypothetical protein
MAVCALVGVSIERFVYFPLLKFPPFVPLAETLLIGYANIPLPRDALAFIQQDQVVGLVAGSYSMPTRAVAPLFQDEGIPLVAAYAIHPDVTKAGDFNFRNGFLGAVEGRGVAYTAVELLKAKVMRRRALSLSPTSTATTSSPSSRSS